MALGRREFIIGSVGAGAASGLLGGCDDGGGDGGGGGDGLDWAKALENEPAREVFAHGVASGDPLSDGVLLWTRVTREGDDAVDVHWVVAKDVELSDIVEEGVDTADVDRDFTLTIDVSGLEAGTTYYYAFAVSQDERSVIGRTRTLPAEGVEHLRIAFTSCANYNNGYFNAYRAIAKRQDLDLWIHLGDYIYEYADIREGEDVGFGDPTIDRAYEPRNEILTLEDYRTRHAQYRTDPDLQELHRQYPIIAVWDDHETANDSSVEGAQNHQEGEGDWQERRKAGMRAFLEWLPVRAENSEPTPRIYRSFQLGGLVDLIMLDTRMWARDLQAGYDPDVGDPAVWTDPERTLIGDDQEAWLLDELDASRERGTTWRFVGNQIIFSPTRDPLAPDKILYADFWDGYQAQRTRIMDAILENGVTNLVFLTGDIHTSWAIELAKDPFDPEAYNPETGEGAFGVELVGPAVTSVALENDPQRAQLVTTLLVQSNPQVKFSEVTRKGYVLLDVTAERVQAEWFFVLDFKNPNKPEEELFKVFTCNAGEAHLVEGDEATPARTDAPDFAP